MTVAADAISLEQAVAVYERMPAHLHAGSLHPLYVAADACRSADLQPCFWYYEEAGEKYLHGFHSGVIAGTAWQDMQSPYGYGGPLATSDDAGFLATADQAFVAWATEQNIVAEFMRFHPLLENWRYYGGNHFHDRDTVWVDCTSTDLLMSYEIRQRTAIRKAIKEGVQVRPMEKAEMLEVFPDFYRDAMRAMGAADFYFFTDGYFQAMAALPFITGLVAEIEGEIVAMSLFLQDGIGEYHLSAKNLKGARHSAASSIMHQAFTQMHEQGLAKAYLGGGTTSAEDDALFFFKAGFSEKRAQFRIGKRVIIPALYEQLKIIHAEQYARNLQRILFYRS